MGFKFIRKKECYVLSWWGKLIVLISLILFISIGITWTPAFLSKSNPVDSDILIVDGHLPDYMLEEIVLIFNTGNYKKIICTGSNFNSGFHIVHIKSMPELSRETFIKLGIEPSKIISLSTGETVRNRTFTSGIALKKWLLLQDINEGSLNVVSGSCHARRSEFLFQKALGGNYNVGVITVKDKSYDSKKWWKSSKGARTVISESIAYIYSVLFFFPDNS